MPGSLRGRLLVAVPLALLLIGAGAIFYLGGLVIGVMATDACGDIGDWKPLWLEVLWPGVMLVSALVPPALVIKNVRWSWILLSMFAGATVSIGCFILWFPIVAVGC